jgi:hypothetical protein
MLAQAKWLYNQLTDDSFLTDFGGDSFGTIYTSIKDIAGRYRHDRDSISKWLALLERKEVVWLEWAHPFCLIHITAIVPRPQERATMLQRMRARAGSARFSRAEGVGTPFFKPSSGEPALNAEENRTISGNVPARRAEGIGTTCGHLPHDVRKVSVKNDRQLPQTPPVTPADCAGTSPHTMRASSAHGADGVGIEPRQSSTGTASNVASKESLKKEVEELKKGEPTPPRIPKFEKLDSGMWAKDRLKAGPQQIEVLKDKIHALENSRTPLKGASEIIAVYRSRIKEIKSWMAQEVAA